MAIREEFKDVSIVDSRGNVEYVMMGDTDFFQVNTEIVIGTKVTQWYQNRSDSTSTLMQAVNEGTEALNYMEHLVTNTGRIVRQYSDTLCIKDRDKVVGAIEFAWYDPKRDIVYEPGNDAAEDDELELCITDYIGESQNLASIKNKISKAADITAPILITGETGTGKEMLARIIHNSGCRADREFVYVNCAALPENLLESILFGTSKGSFTGSEDKEGLFQTADGGTLFLDELNNMPLSVQGKLLKAIEEKRIRKIGDDKDRNVDVRIITSCNIPTAEVIESSSFRKDLFFRISAIQFELPALRNRREDISLLCEYFVRKFSRQYSKRNLRLAPEAVEMLMNYNWPGNVRELRNAMESAVYRTEGPVIGVRDLGIGDRMFQDEAAGDNTDRENASWERFRNSGQNLKEYMRQAEAEIIRNALENRPENESYNETIRRAAEKLGISRQSLKQKMQKTGVER